MDILERLTGLADYGARWILWLLLGLSLVGVAVILERAVLFVSSRDDLGRLRRELRRLLAGGEVAEARRKLDDSPSFEARIAAAGLEGGDAGSAEELMQGETEVAKLAMERNLALLGTLGNNAPFVGLLGTVIGIVRAFRELEHSAGQVSAGLMAEVGEALIATAIGLLVALPAVACFNLYQRVIRARLGRAQALCHEVMAYRKGASVPQAAE